MVNWNGDKDAILLMGIFEVMDLKVSMALCQKLADKIGEGCTAKAVSHRISNLKNRGRPAGGTPTSTPRKTPASSGGGRARKPKNVVGDGGLMDDDEELKSPTLGRKRGRKAKAQSEEVVVESDDEGGLRMSKKMKMKEEEKDEDFVAILGKKDLCQEGYVSEEDELDEENEFV